MYVEPKFLSVAAYMMEYSYIPAACCIIILIILYFMPKLRLSCIVYILINSFGMALSLSILIGAYSDALGENLHGQYYSETTNFAFFIVDSYFVFAYCAPELIFCPLLFIYGIYLLSDKTKRHKVANYSTFLWSFISILLYIYTYYDYVTVLRRFI